MLAIAAETTILPDVVVLSWEVGVGVGVGVWRHFLKLEMAQKFWHVRPLLFHKAISSASWSRKGPKTNTAELNLTTHPAFYLRRPNDGQH